MKPREWTHIAIARDLKAAKLRWYVNGRLAVECDSPYPAARSAGLPLQIGKGFASNFAGLIDEVAIWNMALTTKEIAKVHETGQLPHKARQVVGAALELKIGCANLTIKKSVRPMIVVTIKNTGETAATLVQPGDGSHCKWRTPIVGWSAISADDNEAGHPKTPPLLTGGRCGNINSLKPDEIFVLKPGDQTAVRGWMPGPAFLTTGRHSVVFYYFNDPTLKWRGLPLGKHDDKAMQKVKSSTRCELISNELVFAVVE